MTNKDIVNELNNLITTCQDAEDGFQHAAQNAEDPGLKTWFQQVATVRATARADLQRTVEQLGEQHEDDGSILASMHRTWMDIKNTFTDQDDETILNETIRGDKSALEIYEERLEKDLPAPIKEVLHKQHAQVQQTINRMETERNRLHAVNS